MYKNKDTGEIITHGDIPNETEQHLKTDKVEYEIIENVEVYKVVNKNDGQIIDCVTLQNKEGKSIPVKVRVGNQYEKEYISVLEDMGMVIPKGINYYEHYEEQNDLPKREFIKAVEELEKNTKVDELEDERT